MPNNPSIDREIEDLRKSIHQFSRVLYKIYRYTENATGRVSSPLDSFDSTIWDARQEVAKLSAEVDSALGKFPSKMLYLAVLVLIDLLICAIIFFLILKILKGIREIKKVTEKEAASKRERRDAADGPSSADDDDDDIANGNGRLPPLPFGAFQNCFQKMKLMIWSTDERIAYDQSRVEYLEGKLQQKTNRQRWPTLLGRGLIGKSPTSSISSGGGQHQLERSPMLPPPAEAEERRITVSDV